MANTNQPPRDDYGFDEDELSRPISDSDRDREFFRDDDDSIRDDVDRDDFDDGPEAPSTSSMQSAPETAENFFSKYRLYLIVGGCGLIIFGGLVWAAMRMMAPHPVTRSSAPTDFSSQAMMQRTNPATSPATDPVLIDEEVVPGPQRAFPNEDQVQPSPVGQVQQQVAPITQRTVQEQDDTFYDSLVRSSDRGSAEEQVPKVQAGSVSSRTDDKLEALSKAITDSSREMGIVLNAVKVLSEDVKSLRQQVEANSSKSTALESQLGKVSAGLDDLSRRTESRLKEISKNAVGAAIAAVAKDQRPKQEKLVLVGGKRESDSRPLPKQSASVSNTAPTPIVQKTPVRAVAASAPQENKGNQGQQCQARTVSQNWKVKGITNSGAYVRRSDGEAAMLRLGYEVSGFGRVVSFDPVSRTVCTTNGLIAR
ncbi:hypothetical protein SJI00_20880 [Pseudomonas sp. RP23018S]|uniref:hypothetical protein n=1 Tax=Pseudomonas sp. RP23018S TaxID=3096037 RepID=UPI002ACA3D3B|nr:hypothetical protein [Pseudomonas sp. RP23018S]MDZ5605231.1 hypothetical protein [Pseudomonas sp. RP23018S]